MTYEEIGVYVDAGVKDGVININKTNMFIINTRIVKYLAIAIFYDEKKG